VEVPEIGEDDTRNAGLIALDDFSRQLAMHIAKYKKFPRIAQRRGWQGEVILQVKLTGQGQLIEKKLRQSSGFKVLDEEGLSMIDRAIPFPTPPSILSGRTFTILVPIKFTLL
jgi:periplasmic protein TonB